MFLIQRYGHTRQFQSRDITHDLPTPQSRLRSARPWAACVNTQVKLAELELVCSLRVCALGVNQAYVPVAPSSYSVSAHVDAHCI